MQAPPLAVSPGGSLSPQQATLNLMSDIPHIKRGLLERSDDLQTRKKRLCRWISSWVERKGNQLLLTMPHLVQSP